MIARARETQKCTAVEVDGRGGNSVTLSATSGIKIRVEQPDKLTNGRWRKVPSSASRDTHTHALHHLCTANHLHHQAQVPPPAHTTTDMAAMFQQLPTAQLRDPLTVTFSRSSGDERRSNSGTTFFDLGPTADGWTDRVSPRPTAARARAAASSRQFLRFRAPSDEAIELANTFTSY